MRCGCFFRNMLSISEIHSRSHIQYPRSDDKSRLHYAIVRTNIHTFGIFVILSYFSLLRQMVV